MIEEWRDSISLSGSHQVSNLGRIRGIDRAATSGMRFPGRMLNPPPNERGYRHITIMRHGKVTGYLLHRLIAEVFVPNPRGLNVVNHIDGDATNNRASNLEWCDQRHNVRHAIAIGLTNCTKAVISDAGGNGYWYPSIAAASAHSGASRPCICAALKGKQKTAGKKRWAYAEQGIIWPPYLTRDKKKLKRAA